MMNKFNRAIIQTISLTAFIIAGMLNVSYGQSKAGKLDKLVSTYAEYGNLTDLSWWLKKVRLFTKRRLDWPIWNGISPTKRINYEIRTSIYALLLMLFSTSPMGLLCILRFMKY